MSGLVWVCRDLVGRSVRASGVPFAPHFYDILHNYSVAKITCSCDFNLTKIVKQKIKVSTTIITTQIQQYEEITKEVDDIEIIYDDYLQQYVKKPIKKT